MQQEQKSNISSNLQNNEEMLWEKVYKVWENGENRETSIKKNQEYWKGINHNRPDAVNFDATLSWYNLCRLVTETKISSILDNNFSIDVLPEYSNYSNFEQIKFQEQYADILNQEIKNILKRNKQESLEESSCRWGLVSGLGVIQTYYDVSDKVEGEIKLKVIDPKTMRWDKNAKCLEDLSFIAYKTEMNVSKIKLKYCKNPDGTYNKELCDKVDRMAQIKESNIIQDKNPTGVVAGQTAESAGLMYAYQSKHSTGLTGDKIIELIEMFIIDDSFYAPDKNESAEQAQQNIIMQKMYPNGRVIIFSTNKEEKMIFDDKPMPESFKNLGNMDFFAPDKFDELLGTGEVEKLAPLQDSINGSMSKAKVYMAQDVSTIVMEGSETAQKDGAFVKHGITYVENLQRAPIAMSNNMIATSMQIYEQVQFLKQMAFEQSRLNETMVNGQRQTGTNSGEQVEALENSPLASNRQLQRNFYKDFWVSICEKILGLIHNYYSVQRLIKISTGMDDNDFARFSQNPEGENIVELINKAGQVATTIKIDPDWKFRVDITAGTEIPRSRRENASLTKELGALGILGNIQDPDIVSLYLKSLDYPNAKAFTNLMKKKQEDALKNPPKITIKDIVSNPQLSKSFKEIMDALEYNSQAKSAILKYLELPEMIDKLADAPAQTIMSKADPATIIALSPGVASSNMQEDIDSRIVAGTILENKLSKEKSIGV